MYIQGGFNWRVGATITNDSNGTLNATGYVLAQFYLVVPSGNVNITLPLPNFFAYLGATVTFKKNAVLHGIILTTAGSSNILDLAGNLQTSVSISQQMTLICNGTYWCVIIDSP